MCWNRNANTHSITPRHFLPFSRQHSDQWQFTGEQQRRLSELYLRCIRYCNYTQSNAPRMTSSYKRTRACWFRFTLKFFYVYDFGCFLNCSWFECRMVASAFCIFVCVCLSRLLQVWLSVHRAYRCLFRPMCVISNVQSAVHHNRKPVLPVSIGIDCLERLASEIIYYLWRETLNYARFLGCKT